jgi:hypothetical protein
MILLGEAAGRWLEPAGNCRPRGTVPINRLALGTSGIIPGDWGKDRSGWLAYPLCIRTVKSGGVGTIHQFLWRRSRAVSDASKGLCGEGRCRNRSKPSQVPPGRFRTRKESQSPRGCKAATARQHGAGGSAAGREVGLRSKGAERRDKVSTGSGEATGRGMFRENLPQRRRCYKRHRWPVSERQLEG